MSNIESNSTLNTAKTNKADEFYTMLEDIEAELSLYNFSNKSVFCPCDEAGVSNFHKYFKIHFSELSLKRLVSFHYNPFNSSYTVIEKQNGNIIETVTNIISEDAGDFRSNISKIIMSECDVIVTNPPFSLFRAFISQIMCMNKEFVILGNVNAITYKEVFHYIVEGKVRLGGTIHSGDRKFYIHDDYPLDGTACGVDETGNRFIRVKGVRWFTNMNFNCPNVKHTIISMKYNPDIHQKFDTYGAINVNSMKEIPVDYYDEIGAPITVIDKMNADGLLEFKTNTGEIILFKLIGQLNAGNSTSNYDFAKPIIDGKCKFKRVLIKRI